jgi:hypothetical protein
MAYIVASRSRGGSLLSQAMISGVRGSRIAPHRCKTALSQSPVFTRCIRGMGGRAWKAYDSLRCRMISRAMELAVSRPCRGDSG